ncbi:MAG: hypothetical protein QX203_01940 [Methylococcaceae bacterium]
MNKINIFLASSNELKAEREQFEIQMYRKCKAWVDRGLFLHLTVWEDLSARMSDTRSQDEYNKKIAESDIFVLLAYSKVGMYSAEEFDHAFGAFKETQKPFIFTYFKETDGETEPSLQQFKDRLKALDHFYARYTDFNDLWLQFNRELDRLEQAKFKKNAPTAKSKADRTVNQGDKSVYIEKAEALHIAIQ